MATAAWASRDFQSLRKPRGLARAVAWLGHLRKLALGRETAEALVRGLLQMLAVGLVLVVAAERPGLVEHSGACGDVCCRTDGAA
jgi:hypothetical protein